MMYSAAAAKKRCRREKSLFGIHTFGDPGCPGDYDGPFRENIRRFLDENAEPELYPIEGMPAWSIALQEGDAQSSMRVSLLMIEEGMQESLHPHCDHCRCIGWSHHPVSSKRYHFIIPAPELDDRPLGLAGLVGGKVCPNCSDPIPPALFNCQSCGEDAVMGSILDLQSHLLHGVLHSNGFGHLLRINGREKGSKVASGREIMDLWDRVCAMLRARKVSVEDVAKKRGLELRLLHSVAYGGSWYGRWGYKFGHGSFGISQQMYLKAIEAIRGMPLSVMVQHFEGVDQDVLAIVAMYQRISGQALQTVGDLIRFMMELKARLPLHAMSKAFGKGSKDLDKKSGSSGASSSSGAMGTSAASDLPCRWSVKRLDLATQVIVEALKTCEKKWMPRQDVRDAARVYIGDTGLLDFVLKSLGNRVVGGHVVRRAVNPITKVLEYSLEDVNVCSANARERCQSEPVCEVGRAEVLRDIVYIYKHVLESYKPARRGIRSVLTAIPTAARIILDTKQFIKDYCGEVTRKRANNEWCMDDDEMLRVMCTLVLTDRDPNRNRPSPPAELVVLPPHATIGDLKLEAQRAFRETYHIMHSFTVVNINLAGADEDLLFGNIESGSTVVMTTAGVDTVSDWRYEGGNDSWVVDCPCGTRDDDGERMIACDVCEVWQHTRCGGISDLDAVPLRFLCHRCGVNLFHAML